MKILKRTKKGFTLVELIVVIAIVAILAAVSVVSYLAFINQANESADIQLVKQLNVALQADETLNGTRDTMKEMLVGMEAQGFVVENLTKTKSGYDIVWDQENNRFVLLNSEDKVIYSEASFSMNKNNMYTFWKFADTENEASNKKYSVYLTDEFKGVDTLTVGAGLDAGNYVGLTEVTYDNSANDAVAQTNVILNTNSGKLTINGPKDTVAHRGYAKSVDIIAVDELHSYHEYGEVGFTQIEKGHYVGEEGAKVTVLLATGSASDVTIDNNGADIEKAYTTDESAKETQHGGNESLDYYEVTPAEGQTQEEAIAEAIETLETGSTLFAGGTGTESDPFLIVDYDTFQHVTTLSWTYYAYESYYGAEHYHDWNYACNYANSFDTISDAYFKVKDGISSIDCKNWVPVFLDGNFDGNGVILNNLDKGLFDTVDGESSTIKNFTVNANISVSGGVGAVVYDSGTLNLIIDSVDVHGTIIGASWVTPYVEFGPGPSYVWNLTIKNSVSDATLVATSGSASGFVGHPYDDVSNGSVSGSSLITIIDSAYIGNMSATGSATGTNFKYFTINGNDNRIKTYYSEEFIEELGYNPEGTLYATPTTGYENKGKTNEVEYLVINNEDGSKTFLCGNYGKNVVDNYKPTEKKAVLNTTSQATLPANIGDVFTVTKVSGAVKAAISLQIAPNDQNNYGSYLGTYMSEEIDISSVASGSTFTSKEVRYFTININSGATSETGVSGNIFNVVNSYYGKNAHNGASVKIVQFDANGNVLNITSIQIAAPHTAE